jgi:hypothetical protein
VDLLLPEVDLELLEVDLELPEVDLLLFKVHLELPEVDLLLQKLAFIRRSGREVADFAGFSRAGVKRAGSRADQRSVWRERCSRRVNEDLMSHG